MAAKKCKCKNGARICTLKSGKKKFMGGCKKR